MQEQEQTLADLPLEPLPAHVQAQFRRWLDTEAVCKLIHDERDAQHEQWGDQDIPLGTGLFYFKSAADWFRSECQRKAKDGTVTYADILLEEVFEALGEPVTEPHKLRDELVQAAAVIVKMIELLDRHHPLPPAAGPDSAEVPSG